jgi:CheY-like chemotaxis protein
MSHEIRTPMTAIMGYTELLAEQESDGAGCPQRREYVETIRRNGEHLLGILNDILDLSKIEARRMTVERVETRPWAILKEVHELMLVKARAKGLRLELAADTPIPEAITSDPVRVRQVLVNLVGNAIKFTEVGGVRVGVSYRGAGEGGEMIICVTDTGVGLSAEQIGRIFAPFAQADVSTTRRFGGSGLGLSICQRLAEMLGGKIAVESLPGRGSTFMFTLSAEPWGDCRLTTPAMGEVAAAVTAPSQRQTGAGPLEGVRVVFVEDGLDNQRLISLLLRRAGASVRHFVNGRVALEGLTADGTCEGELPGQTGFDLVLTDMQMPEMDGYELARRLRAKGWRGPIIALTAHAMAGDREKCIEAGCDGYLCKPVDPRRLQEACLESLARTAAAR